MKNFIAFDRRVDAIISLGKAISSLSEGISISGEELLTTDKTEKVGKAMRAARVMNPWFTFENQIFVLKAWANALDEHMLLRWIEPYRDSITDKEAMDVAVIMAGNIPMVGMHDFLCTLLTGNRFIGKVSRDDKQLLPIISELLCDIEPEFRPFISFQEGTIKKNFDAVIATGSNNTSRYFEYYFSKYPHIIRKNRNGVALISGNENTEQLTALGSDICRYFGMGCRSVSKLFLPADFNPGIILENLEAFHDQLFRHHKYMNNYNYQKTIFQINLKHYYDNGTSLLQESSSYTSPISVVHYEFYDNLETLKRNLLNDRELIQCLATTDDSIPDSVRFGKTQEPQLWDYADGIDTVRFLLSILNQ
jgi:hypothetical protein